MRNGVRDVYLVTIISQLPRYIDLWVYCVDVVDCALNVSCVDFIPDLHSGSDAVNTLL